MQSDSSKMSRKTSTILFATLATAAWLGMATDNEIAADAPDTGRDSKYKKLQDYTMVRDWHLKGENLVPTGHNPYYFPFKPGFKFVLEHPDHPDGPYRKEVKVLEKTEPFDLPGIGKFHAAVIQEDEFFEGVWAQRALNWYAIDKTTNSVYAFGELSWEIDEEGNKVFEGTWRAGEPDGGGEDSPNADPGLLMPGTFNIGARYVYDGSETESLGGTENQESGITMTTPAGTFHNVIRTREQSLTYLDDVTDKWWAPGVGLIKDTSDGELIASDALPDTDLSDFGKFHLAENRPQFPEPVAKISGTEAAKIALEKVPGRANAVSIERKRQTNVYVVEVIQEGTGRELDVYVDIATGEVVGVED